MIIVNNKNYIPQEFSNGERKFFIEKEGGNHLLINKQVNFIELKYENDLDLITLMMVKKYIDEYCPLSEVVLKLGYIPYSRMDKTNGENIFSLKYVCEFINNLKFTRVEIIEPHSDVAPALLNNVYQLDTMFYLINEAKSDFNVSEKDICFYFTDTIVGKRQIDKIKVEDCLIGLKHRDFTTGNIKSLEVVGECDNLNEKVVFMVDDLCSFGETFVLGAKKLKELGANKIVLLVPHCENNITKGKLFESGLIDKVYTTDTILRKTEDINELLSEDKMCIINI